MQILFTDTKMYGLKLLSCQVVNNLLQVVGIVCTVCLMQHILFDTDKPSDEQTYVCSSRDTDERKQKRDKSILHVTYVTFQFNLYCQI